MSGRPESRSAFFTPFLKSRALGDLAVFLNFGILGSLGAWVVQTRSFSWLPVVWTVPMSMLVVAILHANNWRDSISDSGRKVTTALRCWGTGALSSYYGLLVFGSMGLVLGFMILPRMLALASRPFPGRSGRRPGRPAPGPRPLEEGQAAPRAATADGLRHPGRGDGPI